MGRALQEPTHDDRPPFPPRLSAQHDALPILPTHEPPAHDPEHPQNPGIDSPGYEVTDVNVNGIVVFLASLGAFVGVCYYRPLLQIDPTGQMGSWLKSAKSWGWSGWRESNPRMQLGKLPFYH